MQPTKYLVVKHSPDTPPGLVTEWLKENSLQYQEVSLHLGEKLPTQNEFQALILLGGAPNVDQEDKYPWLTQEKRFLTETISSGKKILGLCLGAQLCAENLGAKVYAHPNGWEVGWRPVSILTESQSLSFFHYHRYVFELPKGAELIAKNDWWQCQGFTWKNQILAYQFHPETELPWAEECALDSDLPATNKGAVQSKEEILVSGPAMQPKAKEWFFKNLNSFFRT